MPDAHMRIRVEHRKNFFFKHHEKCRLAKHLRYIHRHFMKKVAEEFIAIDEVMLEIKSSCYFMFIGEPAYAPFDRGIRIFCEIITVAVLDCRQQIIFEGVRNFHSLQMTLKCSIESP